MFKKKTIKTKMREYLSDFVLLHRYGANAADRRTKSENEIERDFYEKKT